MTIKETLIQYYGFRQYPNKNNILISRDSAVVRIDKVKGIINLKRYQINEKPYVYLQHNNKNKTIIQKATSVAKIMAKTFHKYNSKKDVIIHIDNDLQNCNILNLKIMPKSYYENVYKYIPKKLTQNEIENELLKSSKLSLFEQLKTLGYI